MDREGCLPVVKPLPGDPVGNPVGASVGEGVGKSVAVTMPFEVLADIAVVEFIGIRVLL
jgi:hypothetical protein